MKLISYFEKIRHEAAQRNVEHKQLAPSKDETEGAKRSKPLGC